MSLHPNHYATLGMDAGMPEVEMHARWREVARRLHPDRHVLKSREEQRAATAAFAEASAAWAVLGDRKARAEYDRHLRMTALECAVCKGEGRTWRQKGPLSRVGTTCESCGGSGRIERRLK